MDSELENLDFIDALSERHLQLRKITEKLWNEKSDIYLSNSEWFIMARIYKSTPTIAYVTKHVDISRQATHKFIKNLETKGLVEISNAINNKKDKLLRLTEVGEACYERNEELKANIERNIADKIGGEQLRFLKEVLKSDWGLS
ncbi:MarR family winged helix-turn-helix transcriptional regulator [Virgibacillus natechei]